MPEAQLVLPALERDQGLIPTIPRQGSGATWPRPGIGGNWQVRGGIRPKRGRHRVGIAKGRAQAVYGRGQ